MACEWSDKIFSVSGAGFEDLALDIFSFQYQNNPVYHSYVNALQIESFRIDSLEKIPFLPISFFKTHKIKTGEFEEKIVFESSGTTQSFKSHHYVKDAGLYSKSFTNAFEKIYGSVQDWCIIGLLPSYFERDNSSLVYMVESLIKSSKHPESGFYLNEFKNLVEILTSLESRNQKTLLIGVTFALLELAEKFSMALSSTVIMETGGMKGRREELTREEIHEILKRAFSKKEIHSEYGMTELLSQAYSKANGIFYCPPWMKVMIRDEEDPLIIKKNEDANSVSGAINIIDLANVYSCSFIATDDVGKLYNDGSFEVLGRMDGSDLRGCSLMTV